MKRMSVAHTNITLCFFLSQNAGNIISALSRTNEFENFSLHDKNIFWKPGAGGKPPLMSLVVVVVVVAVVVVVVVVVVAVVVVVVGMLPIFVT